MEKQWRGKNECVVCMCKQKKVKKTQDLLGFWNVVANHALPLGVLGSVFLHDFSLLEFCPQFDAPLLSHRVEHLLLGRNKGRALALLGLAGGLEGGHTFLLTVGVGPVRVVPALRHRQDFLARRKKFSLMCYDISVLIIVLAQLCLHKVKLFYIGLFGRV